MVIAKLQVDGYEWGYFHEIWMENYCLDRDMHPGHKLQVLLGLKIHTSCKISKFCRHFRGTKIQMGKIFDFFISEKTRLYRSYQNKNQLVVTSSSYINLKMKLLMESYLLAQ